MSSGEVCMDMLRELVFVIPIRSPGGGAISLPIPDTTGSPPTYAAPIPQAPVPSRPAPCGNAPLPA